MIKCLPTEGKAIAVLVWTGDEDSQGLRIPDFMAFDICRW